MTRPEDADKRFACADCLWAGDDQSNATTHADATNHDVVDHTE